MSKTVKRVKTVMLIGLAAMLGAQAEAHTRVVNGKPRVCSICDDEAMLEDVREDPTLIFAIAELIVKTQKTVTILCPDGTEVQVKKELTLVGETPSQKWKWNGVDGAVVPFVVSGSILGFCGFDKDGRRIASKDVHIPKMSLTYNVYECTGPTGPDSTPCSSKALVSTMKLNDCKAPEDPGDFEYECKKPKPEHVL